MMIPVSLNLHKIWMQICVNGRYFLKIHFVNYVLIVFNEIDGNPNKRNSCSIKKTTFWIISFSNNDNLRNLWLWYYRNFIIVIVRRVNDWNFGTFFKIPFVVRIYAWFFMDCRNHHIASHANHVINPCRSYLCFKGIGAITHLSSDNSEPTLEDMVYRSVQTPIDWLCNYHKTKHNKTLSAYFTGQDILCVCRGRGRGGGEEKH